MSTEKRMDDMYVVYNHKKLRCGYTTGSCAAAAAKAAVKMLLTGIRQEEIGIVTPNGVSLVLAVNDISYEDADGHILPIFNNGEPKIGELKIREPKIQIDATDISLGGELPAAVTCAVQKDGGDDIDATHGAYIYARAEYSNSDDAVEIDGGIGVGRVTKPGLDQPVGAAAINHVPREMITEQVLEVRQEFHCTRNIRITISVPQGEEIAQKTFNPRLGIVGGISILGTSGIVYPMSEKALIDTMRVEMKMHCENGAEYLLITPGNYGEKFAALMPELDRTFEMKCSNFIGETVDMAASLGVKGILFVSHIGKFIKLSGGIMNTHSHEADCRAELMAAAAIRAGGDASLAAEILATNTTEDALDLLFKEKDKEFIDDMMQNICNQISYYLNVRSRQNVTCGAIIFSSQYGKLGETKEVPELIHHLHAQNLHDCK